jgi:O-antigen ligase
LAIPFVTYLVISERVALKVIEIWIFAQIIVIFSSYGLWLGLSIPWAISVDANQFYTPFTTTLEQPIMNSVMLSVLWFYRVHFIRRFGVAVVSLGFLLTLINISFLMVGRSGIFSMIIVLTMFFWFSANQKIRKYILLIPIIIFLTLYAFSPKFHSRVDLIPLEITEFQKGNIETSQAIRLEFWHRSIQAIEKKPILGYGVGSWPDAYKIALNGEQGIKADSPHQQFLLWWVEEGTVGLILLLTIFFSIYKDSLNLQARSKHALLTILIVLFFVSFMNCPLQGAGISEFFSLIIGLLITFKAESKV